MILLCLLLDEMSDFFPPLFQSIGFSSSPSAYTIQAEAFGAALLSFICSQHFILNQPVNESNICLCPVPCLYLKQLTSILSKSQRINAHKQDMNSLLFSSVKIAGLDLTPPPFLLSRKQSP